MNLREEVIEIVRERPKPRVLPPVRKSTEEVKAKTELVEINEVEERSEGEACSEVEVKAEPATKENEETIEAKTTEPENIEQSEVASAIDASGNDEAPIFVARAVYEHPFIVRFCHWVNLVALFVMIASGLQIFRAFPSFGAKIPQKDLLHWPKAYALGGWLGGGLQWHLTFMWIYLGTGLLYLGYQLFDGNYKQVLFVPHDVPGVWPMVKHYFFFGPKPPVREAYNPLQKQAYTTVLVLGVLSVISGFVIWKPIQFSWLGWTMGGFHYARIWHFCIMWAILFFVLGHLVMVVLHGWNNFVSMLTGWKKDPEY
jgi:Ni/Fe-hydrogenase b-type cytochrome subunit